jgi:hypothetical protein
MAGTGQVIGWDRGRPARPPGMPISLRIASLTAGLRDSSRWSQRSEDHRKAPETVLRTLKGCQTSDTLSGCEIVFSCSGGGARNALTPGYCLSRLRREIILAAANRCNLGTLRSAL